MASSSSSPEIPASHSTHNHHNHRNPSLPQKLQECLEDLSSRFILNLPEVELASLERVCFQVEQAHWYYEDFIRDEDPSFPSMTLKKFSHSLFGVCPLLKHFGHDHEQAFQSFLAYKTRVPVCGAIMLNETWDKCLLVKGWKSTAAWSFPKGKINEQEPKYKCAIREVLEETGYDLESRINPSDMVDYSPSGEQSVSLFIVPNIREDYPFATRTRKEISKIAWFRLTDLPTWKRNKVVPGKFYLIAPFIGPLKAYIRDHKAQNALHKLSRTIVGHVAPRPPPTSDTESPTPIHSLPAPSGPGSSSHSSDVDNPEPPTPSPQYSAPIVSRSELALSVLNEGGEAEQTISPDSHLAFLLSSLTKSAMPTPAEISDETAVPRLHTALLEPTSTTRAPASQVPVAAAPLRSPSSTSHHARQSPSPSRTVDTHAPPPVIESRSPVHQINASSAPAPSLSPRAARRNPGLSADISPYFTRPAPAAIPKQMRYLTMLENIVKESERITPKLERQMQVMNELLPSHPLNTIPGPHLPDSRMGESFLPPPPGPGAPAGIVFPPGFVPDSPQLDPFTVRPRTSNTFHPVLYPPHVPRASMNDEQLRFMMAGVNLRHPPTHTAGPTPYPPVYSRVGYPLGVPAAFQMTPPQVSQPPLRVIPPQYHPAAPLNEPGPLSAPPLSPSFNVVLRSNPVNNTHLLSILNASSIPRSVTTAPRATTGRHA